MDKSKKIESTLIELDSLLDRQVYSLTVSSSYRGKESEKLYVESKERSKYIYSKGERIKNLLQNCNSMLSNLSKENRLELDIKFSVTNKEIVVDSIYGKYYTPMLSSNLKSLILKCFTYILCRHYLEMCNIEFVLRDNGFKFSSRGRSVTSTLTLSLSDRSQLNVSYGTGLHVAINKEDFKDYSIEQCYDLLIILSKSSESIVKLALCKAYEDAYGKSKIVPLKDDRINEVPDVFEYNIASSKPKVYFYNGTPFSIASQSLSSYNLVDKLVIFGKADLPQDSLIKLQSEIYSRVKELESVLEV